MARRGNGLADRLRAAVEREQTARTGDEGERLDRLAAGRRARAALFEEISAFGRATGFLEVLARAEGVQLGWNGRTVRFEARGEGEGVGVDYAGLAANESQRVYREEALGGRWVWVRTRGAREDRLPLFDQGLEVLLVHALGLPEPDADAPSESPVSTAPSVVSPADVPDPRKRKL